MQWSSSEHDVEHADYSCQICHLKKCTQCNKCRKLLLQCTFVCLLCAGGPAFVCWMELEVWFKSWRQRSTTASGSSPSSAGQKWKSSKETVFWGVFDRNKVLMEWQRDLHGKKGGKWVGFFSSARYCSNYVVGVGEEVKSKRAPIFGFVASLTS